MERHLVLETNARGRPAGILLSLLTIILATWSLGALAAAAPGSPVLLVAHDGTGAFTNIQDAIDAAPANAVVRIGPGQFEECLTVNKPLTLEGTGWQQTVLSRHFMPPIRSDEDLFRRLGPQWESARPEERQKILREFVRANRRPVLTVADAADVRVRGLKFTDPRPPAQRGAFPQQYVVVFTNAQATLTDCAIVGGPGIGVLIGKNANVEMSQCLVAAFWGNGIEIGQREGPARGARISDCDLRNCFHVGILMGAVYQEATIARCHISGAAWHGIRYGSGAPKIIDNLIFGHARSGIYAGGASEAMVRGNVICRNEMDGMSCWQNNHDRIEQNTFAQNGRAGVAVLGNASPVLRRNLFVGHPQAVSQGQIAGQLEVPFPKITLQHNGFWNNQTNIARGGKMLMLHVGAKRDEAAVKRGAKEDGGDLSNVEVDPQWDDPTVGKYALAADSPLRRDGIGVSDPLAFASPWPLLPKERAMIPQGDSRDSKLWRFPEQYVEKTAVMKMPKGNTPNVAATPLPVSHESEADLPSLAAIPVAAELPGVLLFHGRYLHRNTRREIAEPSELWLKQTPSGALTALARVPFMNATEMATSDATGRFTTHQLFTDTSENRPAIHVKLQFTTNGKTLLTRRGLRQDCDEKELLVPAGAFFDPNSRPDSYCAANVLLRAFDVDEGETKEFRVFDWDATGDALADYTVELKHLGKETVEVPAGRFEANHLVLTQRTSANTWFKKRAGHVTEFWVLNNQVIVRIRRHREPYEVALLDFTVPEKLSGYLGPSSVTALGTTN